MILAGLSGYNLSDHYFLINLMSRIFKTKIIADETFNFALLIKIF